MPITSNAGDFQKGADTVQRFMFDLGNYRNFPTEHGKRILTRNMVECVNAGIKQRTRVVAALPGSESLPRLIGSILIDKTQ